MTLGPLTQERVIRTIDDRWMYWCPFCGPVVLEVAPDQRKAPLIMACPHCLKRPPGQAGRKGKGRGGHRE